MSTTKITEQLKAKIKTLFKQVVVKEHKVGGKIMIKDMPGRISLACPYCGDSTKDEKMKRGNLYWDTLQYHCFNCGQHSDAYQFLKDHGIKLNADDTIEMIDYVKEHRVEANHVDVLQHGTFSKILELAPTKQDLRDKLGFQDIIVGEMAFMYLRGRMLHNKLDNFMYSPKDKRLYILNLGPENKVVGMQSRALVKTKSSRYLTYELSKIKEWLGQEYEVDEQTNDNINKISTLFGIMQVDMTRPVTVFEGPMDRLFMFNSLALASAQRDTTELDEIPTMRYMFDNDKVGKEKMMQKLKRGKSVFTWEKYLKETKMDKYSNKIKDLNDLVMASYSVKSDCLKKIEAYFSTSPLDAYYL